MFHILGFLFFIILVVLVIGLLILSKVCKVRIRASGQLTLLKIISRTLVRKRQQILTPHKEMCLCVNVKRFSIKTKGNTWNSKKSTKNPYLFFRKKSFISPAHSSASTPFTTTVFGCRA